LQHLLEVSCTYYCIDWAIDQLGRITVAPRGVSALARDRGDLEIRRWRAREGVEVRDEKLGIKDKARRIREI
jgi:hypothetical protein